MSTIATSSSAASPARQVNPWLVALAVVTATFIEVLDTTITNVALPHIAGNLSASNDESTWVLTSYLVSNAIVLPMTGWLAKQFSRKSLLLASVAGFTVASLFCGLAPSLPILIFWRIVQGFTGGGLAPFSQAILLEVFPPEKQGKAMAAWMFAIIIAPLLGPMLGGYIVDNFTWRWIFYVNIPIGALSYTLCRLYVSDPPYLKRNKHAPIDYWGMGLLAIAIGSLQVVLDKGQEDDWLNSPFIVTLSIIMAVTFVLFLIRELRIQDPVVDLSTLADRNFSVGVISVFVASMVLYGTTTLIPLFFQTMLGYPAFDAGRATMPRGAGSMIAMAVVGMISNKFDGRKIMALGLALAGGATWYLGHIDLTSGARDLLVPQFLQGISMGMIFVPLTTLSYATIAKSKIGNATSMFNLMRNIGGSVGISTVTTIISRGTQSSTAILGENVRSGNQLATNYLTGVQTMLQGKGFDAVMAAHVSYAAVFSSIQQQAWMLSFIRVARLFGVLFLLIIPLALSQRRTAHSGGQAAAKH